MANSKSDTFENDLLKHIFQNAAISLVGDATGLPASATEGNLYVGLHTSSPGETGDQTTNETSYTNYARVAVPRNTGGWTVSTNTVSNAATVTFPTCGTTGATLTHFGVGTASSGAGKRLYQDALTSNLTISSGTAPKFLAGQLTGTED